MSYKLEAFLLSRRAAELLPGDLRHLHCFPLDDQVALIPVTRQLYQEVAARFGRPEDDPYDMFYGLHPALAEMAVNVSSVSPVLYMELDVASGIGDRAAIVWHNGEVACGPVEGGSDVTRAIQAFGQLQGLAPDHVGQLDYLRHRFTEDWVQHLENDNQG